MISEACPTLKCDDYLRILIYNSHIKYKSVMVHKSLKVFVLTKTSVDGMLGVHTSSF